MRTASRFSPTPARRTSGGPATVARADKSPAASWSEASATALIGRTTDRASWSATATLSTSSSRPTQPSSSQARVTPWRSTESGTKALITAGPPGRPSTATSTCSPPGAWAVKLRPFWASWTAADRAAGWPSSAPEGRKMVTGVPVSALIWSIVSRRLLGGQRGDQRGHGLRLGGGGAHRPVGRERA